MGHDIEHRYEYDDMTRHFSRGPALRDKLTHPKCKIERRHITRHKAHDDQTSYPHLGEEEKKPVFRFYRYFPHISLSSNDLPHVSHVRRYIEISHEEKDRWRSSSIYER